MNKLFFVVAMLVLFKIEAQTSVLNNADSLFVCGNYSRAILDYKNI